MKINKRQLIKLIKESMDDAQIRQYLLKKTRLDIGDFLRQLEFTGTVGRHAEDALKFAGFRYVKDLYPDPDLDDYSDMGPTFRFQAKYLDCELEDLAYVDNGTTQSEATLMKIYELAANLPYKLLEFGKDEEIVGHPHRLYKVGGIKVILSGGGGYSTATIRGK